MPTQNMVKEKPEAVKDTVKSMKPEADADTDTEKTIPELTNETFAGRKQDDPALISYVRQQIIPPCEQKCIGGGDDNSQYKQSQTADEKFLHGMVSDGQKVFILKFTSGYCSH